MADRSIARERAYTLGFMTLVTLVITGLIAGLQLLTAEQVERNEKLFLKRAVMAAAGVQPPADAAGIERWYEAHARPLDAANPREPAFAVVDEATGATQGYVFVRSGAGLWGTIRAAAGLDAALERFTGVTFTEQQETPGLGARIDEAWYKEQFRGRQAPLTLRPEGTRSRAAGEVDAITGATITSRAVQGILNRTRAGAAAALGR